MADKVLDTVLLLALPASGKSETRKYLEHLPEAELARDFHMGPQLQLDDFPYVHIMRCIDDELEALSKPRIFFQSGEKPFINPKDWGTLIELLNDDYASLTQGPIAPPESAAQHMFDRIDAASERVKAPRRINAVDEETRKKVAAKLEEECRKLTIEREGQAAQDLAGKTVVIEFARGGPHGSPLPLPDCFGYKYSLAQLSEAILEKATILYIWVTPEESRRKNENRTDPNDPGSILHHGVPIEVMMNDYGTDDLEWLEGQAEKPNTVPVEAHGRKYSLPIGRFDNRVDKTSFLREDADKWKPEDVKAVHEGLKNALDKLAAPVVS